MAGMVGQSYYDEQTYFYYKNNLNLKPNSKDLEAINRYKQTLSSKQIFRTKKAKNKDDNWEWAKQNLCGKFRPYFNTSLGVRIESREQLRDLERQGTTFMGIEEYHREGKKIKKDIAKKKDERITKKITEKINMVKQGYSFHKEELKKAGTK